MEESRGFIWLGTPNGLYRYDGKEFVVFKHIHDDPSTISYNKVSSIFEDKNGAIWTSTSLGEINRLDLKTGKFKICKLYQDRKPIGSVLTLHPFFNFNGTLLYGGFSTERKDFFLLCYNAAKDRFDSYFTGNKYIDSCIQNSKNYPVYFLGNNCELIIKTHVLKKSRTEHSGNDDYTEDKIFEINPEKKQFKFIENDKNYEILKFL